jgi:nucleoside-diphosphate-sugar epimerase
MEFKGITLVTGAAGFMGSHLVEHLVKNGVRVRATSRARKDTRFFDELGVDFVPSDLTRPETLPCLFDGPVDRIFHLGAICNFSTPYEKLYPTNVRGVEEITALAQKAGISCFVHVTSTSVYGKYPGTPFVETGKRQPCDNYGRSKRDGEDVIFEKMRNGLPAIIVRPCTVYGPRCNDGAGKVFSRPTKIAAVPGNGKQLLSNVRAEDVAAAVLYLSQLDAAIGQVYNIAEDTHPSIGEALTLAARVFHTPAPGRHLPLVLIRFLAKVKGVVSGLKGEIPDLEYDATRYLADDYIVDNSRLKAAGYRFQYPDFTESMTQIGCGYSQNG